MADPKKMWLGLVSGHSSQQGVRPSMEDEVFIKENFVLSNNSVIQGDLSFYGVFDGHGGRAAAEYTRDHLFVFLCAALEQGQAPLTALKTAFLETDNSFIAQCRGEEKSVDSRMKEETPTPQGKSDPSSHLEKDTSGTTAVAVLISHQQKKLWVAHVGDSRAILITHNNTVVSLTNDHKADRPDEVERIRAAGGFVVHKRVMGELAISRAIGDVDFKEKGFSFVLAEPEVAEHNLDSNAHVLILACDGLYDVMTNNAVGEYVTEAFNNHVNAQKIADEIVKHAIERLSTKDNVSVIVVQINVPAANQTSSDNNANNESNHQTNERNDKMEEDTGKESTNLLDSIPSSELTKVSSSSDIANVDFHNDSPNHSPTHHHHSHHSSSSAASSSSSSSSSHPHAHHHHPHSQHHSSNLPSGTDTDT